MIFQRLFPVSPKNIIPSFVPSEEAQRYGIYRFSSHAAETPRSQRCFDGYGYYPVIKEKSGTARDNIPATIGGLLGGKWSYLK